MQTVVFGGGCFWCAEGEVSLLKEFTIAEREHLDYYKENSWAPYCELVINPKLQKLQEKLASLLKSE